jgi:hypothetical protein
MPELRTLKVFDDSKGHGTCRSCGAAVTWYELISGKKHPFKGDPVYLLTEYDKDTRRMIGHLDRADSHFADCLGGHK